MLKASRFTQQCCQFQPCTLERLVIMKTSRITTLALIVTAAASFSAHAENYQTQSVPNFVPTLTRAQVHADALKAARINFQRIDNTESGTQFIGASAAPASNSLTREAVRAEALKARGTVRLEDSRG